MKRFALVTIFDIYNTEEYYIYDRLLKKISNRKNTYKEAIKLAKELNNQKI